MGAARARSRRGRRAIVAGAGIGGLAVARGLLEAGWDVVVYDQAASFGQVGAGITLAPNAVRALDWLGLGAELRAQGAAHGSIGIRAASGQWLLRAPIEALEARFGVPSYALHRATLHELLSRSLPEATIRTGHRITGIRNGPCPVVAFEGPEGAGEDEAELVIGADGIDSRVRAALFPDHPAPAYAGYMAWRGVVAREAAPPGSRDFGTTESWGSGCRFGIVPLGDGAVYWFATLSAPAGSHQDDTLDDLLARHGRWHEPIPAILRETRPGSLLRHEIRYLATPLPGFAAGRVVLLGDAAHAMTPDLGQGGCQALEDAVVLCAALGREGDLPAALAAYERERVGRTRAVVRASARMGRVAEARNPVLVAVRNALLRVVPAGVLLRGSEGVMGWRGPGPLSE